MTKAPHVRRRFARIALAVLVIAGCDGKGATDPPTPGSITVAVASATAAVTQGGTVDVTVNITRSGDFSGAVTLAAEGLPAGVTSAGASIAAGQTQGTLTLSATDAAAPATANVTIRATGTGVDAKTATLALTVNVRGSFTLGGPAAAVSVAQGASSDVPIAINRTGGHTGTVTLTATVPAGITATLTPAAVTGTGTTSTLRVTVGAAVAPGSYTVTLTGNSPGLTAQTVNVSVTVPTPGGFTLSLNPATLSLAQAAAGAVQVNINRTGGFSSAVALTVTAPTGITAAVTPASTTDNTATLNLTVGAGVAVGNQTITVRGNATGIAEQTATLTVQVTAAGGFTLSLAPPNLAVLQGGSSQSTVNINRTGGFSANVALTATTPNGLTVTFNPASAAGATSVMTVAAAAGMTPGSYTVTVRGNATGQAEQTADLAVTVNPSGGQGGNVTWAFCPQSGTPVIVAVQDGAGPWTAVTGSANNTYSFQISSGRGGVAYVSPQQGGGWDLDVFYGTTAELQSGNATCQGTTGAGKTVTGTVAGLSAGDFAFIALGSAFANVVGGFGTDFTLQGVEDGPVDLFASRLVVNQQTFAATLASLVIQRNLNPANNASLGTINFATGFAPASAQLTVNNLGGDTLFVGNFYSTANSTFAGYFFDLAPTPTSTRTWYGVPPAQQQANENHVLSIIGTKLGDATRTRQILFTSRDVVDRTVTLGPDLTTAAVSVAATQPYARPRIAYTVQAEYNRDWVANFQQGAGASYRNASVRATSGYTSNAASVTLEVPDLSGVSGWNNTWGLVTGAQVTWTLSATGYTGNPSITNPFTDGAIFYAATRTGTITP